MPQRVYKRIQRMRPMSPTPIAESILLTGEKLLPRRLALGLSRAQLGALAVVDPIHLRHCELDGHRFTLGEMVRLETVVRALEEAHAQARAAVVVEPASRERAS